MSFLLLSVDFLHNTQFTNTSSILYFKTNLKQIKYLL